jgi:hypothetical protein
MSVLTQPGWTAFTMIPSDELHAAFATNAWSAVFESRYDSDRRACPARAGLGHDAMMWRSGAERSKKRWAGRSARRH